MHYNGFSVRLSVVPLLLLCCIYIALYVCYTIVNKLAPSYSCL